MYDALVLNFMIMSNKTASRRLLVKTKELTVNITSEYLVPASSKEKKKPNNENAKIPKLVFKSSKPGPIPLHRRTKSISSLLPAHSKELASAHTQQETKTPPETKTLRHKRANSDGEGLDDKGMSRNRSTSSLLNQSTNGIKAISIKKSLEADCEVLLKRLKTLIFEKCRSTSLSYKDLC